MGWDSETDLPLDNTLRKLGLKALLSKLGFEKNGLSNKIGGSARNPIPVKGDGLISNQTKEEENGPR
jgi:hypothetical protein